MKSAMIFGVSGQDGQYLSSYLKKIGYNIIGITSRKVDRSNLNYYSIDIASFSQVSDLIKKYRPDEIYNLAAVSSSLLLNDERVRSTEINVMGPLNILESIVLYSNRSKFFQALSSEIFANSTETPQNEKTIPRPINIYGANKLHVWNLLKIYRKNFNIYCCGGILYNHESHLRQNIYLSKKISQGVAKIFYGIEKRLTLGDRHSKRDWGHARDFVKGMHLMLQNNECDDYILSTSVTHSVEDFCRIAFDTVGLDYSFFVDFNNDLGRRYDSIELRGDYSKAKNVLNWNPEVSFDSMVQELVSYEIELIKSNLN